MGELECSGKSGVLYISLYYILTDEDGRDKVGAGGVGEGRLIEVCRNKFQRCTV